MTYTIYTSGTTALSSEPIKVQADTHLVQQISSDNSRSIHLYSKLKPEDEKVVIVAEFYNISGFTITA